MIIICFIRFAYTCTQKIYTDQGVFKRVHTEANVGHTVVDHERSFVSYAGGLGSDARTKLRAQVIVFVRQIQIPNQVSSVNRR